MADPSSQTISDKLHHAFAYFRQFVFVRTKRIETNAISAQKGTKRDKKKNEKRRENAEQKSSRMRKNTRRIKIKPNHSAVPHPVLPAEQSRIVELTLCIQITLPHCSPFLPQHHANRSYPTPTPAPTTTPIPAATSTRTCFSNPPISALFIYIVCHLFSPLEHPALLTLYIVFKNIVSHKFGDTSSSRSIPRSSSIFSRRVWHLLRNNINC